MACLHRLVDGESRPSGTVTIDGMNGESGCYRATYLSSKQRRIACTVLGSGCTRSASGSSFRFQIQDNAVKEMRVAAAFWCKELQNRLDPSIANRAKSEIAPVTSLSSEICAEDVVRFGPTSKAHQVQRAAAENDISA